MFPKANLANRHCPGKGQRKENQFGINYLEKLNFFLSYVYSVELVAGRVEDEGGSAVPLRHGATVLK